MAIENPCFVYMYVCVISRKKLRSVKQWIKILTFEDISDNEENLIDWSKSLYNKFTTRILPF